MTDTRPDLDAALERARRVDFTAFYDTDGFHPEAYREAIVRAALASPATGDSRQSEGLPDCHCQHVTGGRCIVATGKLVSAAHDHDCKEVAEGLAASERTDL